ncbi:hypothetical protein MGYG_05187 [Nannizzia gypsea CBS 118893]|uniref:Uncharacterized protein n=1 Tax=Arthroderma gypseum (strain ATCC MYA-4604 / CBS 118893) TaxID=535722 RepID=E4UV57_ARTGP|nr:hypothetical protein MGYG_05187 [Nannizzia gypsea CBS 118893]EFR02184.1 hypothetical protein MGYG_05187 [Nannizzia gypsea CBS 118893]
MKAPRLGPECTIVGTDVAVDTVSVAGISGELLVGVGDADVDVVDVVDFGDIIVDVVIVLEEVVLVAIVVVVLDEVVREEVEVDSSGVRALLVVDDDDFVTSSPSLSGHIPVLQGSTEQHPR